MIRVFEKDLKGGPIKRIKRRGLLRKSCHCLGENLKKPKAIPFLIRALNDKGALIRAHIVWALGELLLSESVPLLNEKLAEEEGPWF
ncbi:MAG: hypothetical protein Ct9H300mP23_00900 [Nitrospinota bacterium]|nr:MAG: hypothetical protein Ct9H300mP23_00900 [Nitrospinota bacterium]